MAKKPCSSYIHAPLVILTLMNVINIVGFLTPAWAKSQYGIHWIEPELKPDLEEGPPIWVGLWFHCTSEKPAENPTSATPPPAIADEAATGCPGYEQVSSSHHLTRIFVFLGVIALLSAEVTMILYYYKKSWKDSSFMVVSNCIFVSLGSLFLVIGAACFGSFLANYQAAMIQRHKYLDLHINYSFALCMTAAVISLMNLMFFFMDHGSRTGRK